MDIGELISRSVRMVGAEVASLAQRDVVSPVSVGVAAVRDGSAVMRLSLDNLMWIVAREACSPAVRHPQPAASIRQLVVLGDENAAMRWQDRNRDMRSKVTRIRGDRDAERLRGLDGHGTTVVLLPGCDLSGAALLASLSVLRSRGARMILSA